MTDAFPVVFAFAISPMGERGSMIYNDKLVPSRLPDTCAPRQELIDQLYRTAGKRLTYISAPEGYGKTVTALLWLKDFGRKHIWIGLDAYDNSPSVAYKLFCTGMSSVQPENQNMAAILNDPSFSSSPVEHTVRLLSEFQLEEEPYALVIDNIHHITQEEILKSYTYVLQRLPYTFVILLLSRCEPRETVRDLIKEEKAALINKEQLLFSEREISKHFAAFGRKLTADEAKAVRAITGGWAIAVNATAKSGQLALGQGNSLEQYMKRQIWDEWDDRLKDFMLKTAVADEMSAELCGILTGRGDSLEILEMLGSTNAFVNCLGQGLYCYQPTFLDFLRNRLKESGIDERGLYKKAAEYYLGAGGYFRSVRYAITSGDPGVITRVLYCYTRHQNVPLGKLVEMFQAYSIDALPESQCDKYPVLYIMRVWLQFLCGNAALMEHYLDKLYFYLPEIARDYPQLIDMAVLKASLDHRMDFFEQIEQLAQLELAAPSRENPQGAAITVEMPFLHRSGRDYHGFADDLSGEKLKPALSFLWKETSDLVGSGVVSGLCLERNRLEEAMEAALHTQALARESAIAELRFAAYMHLAAAYSAMGMDNQADELLAEAESCVEKEDARHLYPNFLAYKTKVMLWDGSRAAAEEWLANDFVNEAERFDLYKIFQYFTTARAYMVLGRSEMAMYYIAWLKQLGTDFRRPLDTAEACVLQAVLEWMTGKKKEAQQTLEAVLAGLQPYGFIRVVADEGAAVLPILKKVMTRAEKESYKGGLEPGYLNQVHLAVYEQSKRRQGVAAHNSAKPLKLSKQQRHMLSLLAKGYKAAQIAELTGLKISTVKSHIYAAYDKLGATKAVDAVIKARALGFID